MLDEWNVEYRNAAPLFFDNRPVTVRRRLGCALASGRTRTEDRNRKKRVWSSGVPALSAVSPSNRISHAEVIERLFREHNEALVRFLQGRLGSRNEALEVAQEAYVRLLSLDQLGAVSYFRAFLFKTAANLAIDRRRRHQSYGRVMGCQPFMDFTENRTPERLVSGEQTLRHLGRLLESMPAKCRAAFVMSQIDGMDATTIAAELGITDSMVRKYVLRALLHCRERMDLEACFGYG